MAENVTDFGHAWCELCRILQSVRMREQIANNSGNIGKHHSGVRFRSRLCRHQSHMLIARIPSRANGSGFGIVSTLDSSIAHVFGFFKDLSAENTLDARHVQKRQLVNSS